MENSESLEGDFIEIKIDDIQIGGSIKVGELSIEGLEFLDSENGVWVFRVLFEPGTVLPKHFHTGVVHLYTMAGSWHYTEYPDDLQVAGSYLFEPGGSIHQFQVPADNTEVTDTFMIVMGANINFDPDGNYMNIMDAGWIEQVMLAAGKEQGIEPNYIKPKSLYGFSK